MTCCVSYMTANRRPVTEICRELWRDLLCIIHDSKQKPKGLTWVLFGKAITSRIVFAPARSITNLQGHQLNQGLIGQAMQVPWTTAHTTMYMLFNLMRLQLLNHLCLEVVHQDI